MTDSNAAPNAGGNEQNQKQHFEIQKIYLKDVSLETPSSPAVFAEQQWRPEVNLQLNHRVNTLAEDRYEVVLTLTVTAKQGDKTVYLVEVQQAGLFVINGFPQQHLGAMLGAFCPNILFPYGREVISSLIQKGGFPSLMLQPVNFDALYLQQLQARKQAQQNQQESAPNPPSGNA